MPPDVLQKKAEEVWAVSGGEWGTPPGTPLIEYHEMMYGKTKGSTHLRIGNEYAGPDTLPGQAAESEREEPTMGN